MNPDTCLSIVIVNWRSTEYACACIGSIYEHTSRISFEVIVVDNGSPSDDAEVIEQVCPGVSLLKSTKNLGFARANNLGATKAKGEFILFLNPDTKLIQPALEVMVDALRSLPDAGALGCKLLNEDCSTQTSCIQTFPTILNQALDADALRNLWPTSPLWGVAPLAFATSEPVRVEVISGACLLIKKDVFLEVGGFSEDYFMYAEDLDLCQKTVRAGYRNYYTGSTRLIHYGGRSSAPDTATIMKWRSIIRYCEKYRGKTYALLFRFVMALVAMCRLSILAACAALKKPGLRSAPGYSASAKWKAILATLLNRSGEHQRC